MKQTRTAISDQRASQQTSLSADMALIWRYPWKLSQPSSLGSRHWSDVQIYEGGIAGAEIIDGDAEAGGTQLI